MPSTIRGSDNFDTAGGNAVKAWVNFNGTGTVAIRASYNVSSITDNGVGDYTVNFTTAMSDANYSAVMSTQPDPSNGPDAIGMFYARTPNTVSAPTASGFRMSCMNTGGSAVDRAYVLACIFR